MHEELRLDKQICFRLYTAARLITQAYTPMLNELGITYPQYLVLMVLWEQDSQPVNDIAHRLLLEGIVVRKRGKEDKRQQIVSLTAKGKAMEEQAYAIIPAGMGKELKACPFQLDDYAKFVSELDTIIDTLKNKEK